MSGKKEIKKKVAEKGVAVLSDALDKLLNNVKTKQRNKASLQKFEESRSGATPAKPKPKAKVKPKKMATKITPPSKLKKGARKVVESVDPTVAAAVAGLGAVSQTELMQSIGSAAKDVTGSSREQGDSFIESYVPGFPSDRVKNMSDKDRMAEINDYGKRRRAKNNKSDKPTDKPADKPASKKFKLTPKDVTSDQLKKAGLSLGQAGLTKYLNKAKNLGRRPKASDFTNVVKKSGGGMAKKKVIKKANGGMATKWESKWR